MPKKGNAEKDDAKKEKPRHGNDTFKPEYCEEIIELAKKGHSIPKIAVHWGVAKQNIFNWAEANPDFFDALSRAYTIIEDWWTDPAKVATTECGYDYSVITGKDEYIVKRRIDAAVYNVIGLSKARGRLKQVEDQDAIETFAHKKAMRQAEKEKSALEAELMRKQLHEGAPPRDTIQLQEGILEGVNKIADRLIEKEVASK